MTKQKTTTAKPAAPRILRVKQVAERLNISASAVWYKANKKSRHHDPAFPQPFKVSGNVTGWLEGEINAYIEQLATARGKEGNA
jgi:putative prophage regulatory protein